MAITIPTLNKFLSLWQVRGQQVANNTIALLNLLKATPQVDLSALASAVLVLSQAFVATQELVCTIIVNDSGFSTLTIPQQQQIWQAFSGWSELFTFLAAIAVQDNFIVLDSITSAPTNAKLFGAKTNNPAAINATLESIFSAQTIAGVSVNNFYSISSSARENLVSLIAVDWALSNNPTTFGFTSTAQILNYAQNVLENTTPNIVNSTALATQINGAVLTGIQITTPSRLKALPVPVNASVESLSLQYTGTADNWQQIVALNNLIFPYITDNIVTALGTPFANTTLLQSSVSSGNTLILGNVQGLEQNCKILLTSGTTQQIFTVQAIAPVSLALATALINTWDSFTLGGQVTTVEPIVNTFNSAFTTVQTFQSNINQGNILTTGDTILVPIANSANTSVVSNSLSDPLLYGTDIQISTQGTLQVTNGDLGTVSGVTNVAQAVLNRFNTPLKSLVEHPSYGSILDLFVGLGNSANNAFIAKANATQTLLADPRIATAKVTNIVLNSDTLEIDVTGTLQDGSNFNPTRLTVPITLGV